MNLKICTRESHNINTRISTPSSLNTSSSNSSCGDEALLLGSRNLPPSTGTFRYNDEASSFIYQSLMFFAAVVQVFIEALPSDNAVDSLTSIANTHAQGDAGKLQGRKFATEPAVHAA
ncbi:hypothetical protein GIB67_014456 [Kingdonia uniflora]|uniref:Uncharacterized protein n=1 Tax=Kingdonia uniflora TaxID=39325 RepID=A0A7J7LYZ9_9MAGN|nr:hypothetical protein GIB67_014456 [Kingdonia uniflora]